MKKYWLFNCKDISRHVSDSMDRRLSLKYRFGVRFHLMMCRYCARYEKQIKRMRQEIRKHTIGKMPTRRILSDEQKQWIQGTLNRKLNKD